MAFVNDISLDQLKKKSKEMGCSINDLVMTCTSRMFKRYLVENCNDKKTSSLRLAFPLSLRAPPNKIEEI